MTLCGALRLRWVLLAIACAVSACADRPPPQPRKLKIMTFNIRWEIAGRDGPNDWPSRRAMVYDLLRDPALDVAGLQEATPAQVADLQAAVPEMSVHDADPVMNGIAILYRADRFELAAQGAFWFSPTPDVPESTDWSGTNRRHVCAWVRLVDLETRRAFYVYDLHLDLLASSREKSAVLLCDRVAARSPRDPAILLGDFNAAENARPSRYIRGEIELETSTGRRRAPERWVDSFRVVHPDATNVGTAGGFRGRTSGAKIDHIFVPPGTRVLEAAIEHHSVDGRYASDHFPVTATVVLSD